MVADNKRLVCLTCQSEFEEALELCPHDGSELKAIARDSLEGTIFAAKYEITSPLGAGGMGSVYKARHIFLNKDCAIKVMHSHHLSKPERIKRFLQEARAIAALNHPNVISIHEFAVTESGQPFLEMDYLEGVSLHQVLEEEGHLSIDEFVSIFKQVLDGLAHSHKQGVIHRDLKPSNIMLVGTRPHATAKLVDFGIAKLLSDIDSGGQKVTQTGELIGSPAYMSPEQWTAQPMDARSDLYSVGCVMFECLTGMPPYRGESIWETLHQHLTGQLPSFTEVAPSLSIPDTFEELVRKAISKDPAKRFQSAEGFKQALDDAVRFSRKSPLPLRLRRGLARLLREDPRKSLRARVWFACVALTYAVMLILIAQLVFPGGLPGLRTVAAWRFHEFVGYVHLNMARLAITLADAGPGMASLRNGLNDFKTAEVVRALKEFKTAQVSAESYPMDKYPYTRLMSFKIHAHLEETYRVLGQDDLADYHGLKAHELNPDFRSSRPAAR